MNKLLHKSQRVECHVRVCVEKWAEEFAAPLTPLYPHPLQHLYLCFQPVPFWLEDTSLKYVSVLN